MTKKPPDIYLDMSDLRHIFAGFALGIYTCFPEKRDEFANIMRLWAETPSRTPAAREAIHLLADEILHHRTRQQVRITRALRVAAREGMVKSSCHGTDRMRREGKID